MILKIQVPAKVLLEEEAEKVKAIARNGSFCLLPHHIDFISELVPGVLSYEDTEGKTRFVAVDEGILVKRGPEVKVSVRDGTISEDLENAKRTVAEKYAVPEKGEEETRAAIKKLENDFVSNYLKVK